MNLSILVAFSTLLAGETIFETYRLSAEKNIISVLGKGELKEFNKDSVHEYFLFKPVSSEDSAFVVFSSAKGRYENFDYMVIIDRSLTIVNIKILKYRSEYGYEISNKGWLKQFYLKPDQNFEYRNNIDALSGATFSAQSLVTDLNLIMEYLRRVKN